MDDVGVIEMSRLVVKASSINATIEGMKAFNQGRLSREESPGYDETHFFEAADKLEAIALAIGMLK